MMTEPPLRWLRYKADKIWTTSDMVGLEAGAVAQPRAISNCTSDGAWLTTASGGR